MKEKSKPAESGLDENKGEAAFAKLPPTEFGTLCVYLNKE